MVARLLLTSSVPVLCFPAVQWVKSSGGGSAMSRCLRLQGYTTDPASLPVQYRAELAVEGASGALGPDSLRITLFGARGETEVLRLDASRATAGRTLACTFEAANVGQLEQLRIGLAPADEGAGECREQGRNGSICEVGRPCTSCNCKAGASLGTSGGGQFSLQAVLPPTPQAGQPQQHCGPLLSPASVTNMVTGEAASFFCSEWMRSSDPYDFELDAEAEGAQVWGRG